VGHPVDRRRRRALAAAVGVAVLQYAGQQVQWRSLVLVAVAAVLLVPSVPALLPAGTLRGRRGLPTVLAMRGVLAGSFFGAETFVPLMLVTERSLSTTLAGLSLTGAALGWATGSWWQGRPRTRTPRWRLVQLGCGVVALSIATVGATLWEGVPTVLAAMGVDGLRPRPRFRNAPPRTAAAPNSRARGDATAGRGTMSR